MAYIYNFQMYRHLSPKATQKERLDQPNRLKAIPSQPVINAARSNYSIIKKEPPIIKQATSTSKNVNTPHKNEKQSKQLDNLLTNTKMKDLPIPKYHPDKQKTILVQSLEKHQPSFTETKPNEKFSQYYENKVKYLDKRKKYKNLETSDSADSYKSQGFMPKPGISNSKNEDSKVSLIKKKVEERKISNTQMVDSKPPSPFLGTKRVKNFSESDDDNGKEKDKQIIFFRNKKVSSQALNKKQNGGQAQKGNTKLDSPNFKSKNLFLSSKLNRQEQIEAQKEKNSTLLKHKETSIKHTKPTIPKYMNNTEGVLNTTTSLTPSLKQLECQPSALKSDHQRDSFEFARKEMGGKTIGSKKASFNVPKFVPNVGIKSSPYLNKFAFDTSNEFSGSQQIKKIIQTMMTLISDGKTPCTQFNKKEMFSNLKKKQDQHSVISQQINLVCSRVQLKLLSNSQCDPIIEFLFLKKLSESKTTTIFVAIHEKTHSIYCLKRQTKPETKQTNQIQSLITEYKVHKFTSHAHIVRSFCTLYSPTHIYLMMEYMQSSTLAQELRDQIMSSMGGCHKNQSVTNKITKINRIKNILYQIVDALAYLHKHNIIHRDVKPENILISHDTCKLGDFGSCTYTGSRQYVGTLDYAAPEIILQQHYNEKVDLWSVGCIAYQLDVGRPPFYHINREETIHLISKIQYNSSLISDESLKQIIAKLLVKDITIRISADELLQNEFFSQVQIAKIKV